MPDPIAMPSTLAGEFTASEVNWLAWAWRVLAETPEGHLEACRAAGGSVSDPSRLNPAYVGSAYAPGGVLVTSLAWGQDPAEPTRPHDQRAGVCEAWVRNRPYEGAKADRRFLDDWRTAARLDQDSNPYWRSRIAWFVEEHLGLDRSQVAIANLAACQMSRDGLGDRLARLCQPVHDFTQIVAMIQPSVIVAPTVRVEGFIDPSRFDPEPLVIAWNGRTYERHGEKKQDWVPRLAHQARSLLDSPSQPGTPDHVPLLGPTWVGTDPPATPVIIRPAQPDPDLVGRGIQAHASTEQLLAQRLIAHGHQPRRQLPDCPYDLAWTVGGTTIVAEIKSLTPDNEAHQIRYGLGQVLDYRHRLRSYGHPDVQAALVVERAPLDQRWLQVCAEADVILAWPTTLDRLPGITP
ncbi:MAG: hypothetical protein JWO77_3715 [Ilumatobacteraceae bacterium]|nr:hypothetical protein [Ilumatobacteraceae bacterium]